MLCGLTEEDCDGIRQFPLGRKIWERPAAQNHLENQLRLDLLAQNQLRHPDPAATAASRESAASSPKIRKPITHSWPAGRGTATFADNNHKHEASAIFRLSDPALGKKQETTRQRNPHRGSLSALAPPGPPPRMPWQSGDPRAARSPLRAIFL